MQIAGNVEGRRARRACAWGPRLLRLERHQRRHAFLKQINGEGLERETEYQHHKGHRQSVKRKEKKKRVRCSSVIRIVFHLRRAR